MPPRRHDEHGISPGASGKAPEALDEEGGVPLSDYRKAVGEYSAKASDVARTLALSAIAIVWLFHVDKKDATELPAALLQPLTLAVAALACDFLHYVVASLIWGGWARWKERQGAAATTLLIAPTPINWPGNLLYFAKLVLVALCYLELLIYLGHRLGLLH